jgi:sugar lactone lactonase YvrE
MMSFLVRAAAVAAAVMFATTTTQAGPHRSPETIALPLGFQPEGVAAGPRGTLLVGSIPTGAIYQVDPRRGEGELLVAPQEGRAAIGLKRDKRSNYIYVAGGPTGKVFVYDANTGADVAVLQATDEPTTFVNDVVVTRRAVYFTDSFRPVFYRLPLRANGQIAGALETVNLSGDYGFLPGDFNANGIVATDDGKSLIIVHSTLAELYRVDPNTGVATLIELDGDAASNGDGLLLVGCTLYVVQNFANQVAVVRLSHDLSTGTLTDTLQDDDFDVPTTIARVGHSLYAVNARFSTPATPETTYDIVRIDVRD